MKLRFRSWQWATSAHEEGSAGEHGAILPRRLCLTHLTIAAALEHARLEY